MKTNKEQIYDIIRVRAAAEVSAVSIQYVAEALGMKRPNASKLLNELESEGRIEKLNGRPVLYYAKSEKPREFECFDNLAGKEAA